MCDPIVNERSYPLRMEEKANKYKAISHVREICPARELATYARDRMSFSKYMSVCSNIDAS